MREVMLWTNSVPEVPSEQTPWPSPIRPAPIAAQALSPPPATTGVPAGRPVAAAAPAVTRPVTSGLSNTSGNRLSGTSSAASISSL